MIRITQYHRNKLLKFLRDIQESKSRKPVDSEVLRYVRSRIPSFKLSCLREDRGCETVGCLLGYCPEVFPDYFSTLTYMGDEDHHKYLITNLEGNQNSEESADLFCQLLGITHPADRWEVENMFCKGLRPVIPHTNMTSEDHERFSDLEIVIQWLEYIDFKYSRLELAEDERQSIDRG